MRSIIVNDAYLKAQAFCAHCGNRIGKGYVREIANRLIYCDYRCYGVAVKVSTVAHRAPAISAWTRSS
ncbi:MAG TPA: hypothetical protein VMF32_08745 [Xanthobacteraceae bacterium]|nr:hypothetical protein [Xanthobacteraceae bacterium]